MQTNPTTDDTLFLFSPANQAVIDGTHEYRAVQPSPHQFTLARAFVVAVVIEVIIIAAIHLFVVPLTTFPEVLMLGAIAIAGCGALGAAAYFARAGRRERDLGQRLSETGHVVRGRVAQVAPRHSKSGQAWQVHYTFTPLDRSQPIEGTARYPLPELAASTRHATPPEVGQQVAVLYADPQHYRVL